MEPSPFTIRPFKDFKSPREKRKISHFSESEKVSIINVYKYVMESWPAEKYQSKEEMKEKTADILGISKSAVYRILKEYVQNDTVKPAASPKKRSSGKEEMVFDDKGIEDGGATKPNVKTKKKELSTGSTSKKPPVHRGSRWTCPTAEPAPSPPAGSSHPPQVCNEGPSSHHGPENATLVHSAIQCNECGQDVVGFRYKCVQCADCDLCAACEARGAHPDHYVLRIPRPLQLAQARALVERLQDFLEEESLIEQREIQVKREAEDSESDVSNDQMIFKTEEEELLTVKVEPCETIVTDYSGDPLHDLKTEPVTTPRTSPEPAPSTAHRKRKSQEPAEEMTLTKLLRSPGPPMALPRATSITVPQPTCMEDVKPDIHGAAGSGATDTKFGVYLHRQP